jgi:hypothetical protein
MPERLCDGPGHLLPLRHLMIGFLQGISLTERLIISNVPEKNVWREFFSPFNTGNDRGDDWHYAIASEPHHESPSPARLY